MSTELKECPLPRYSCTLALTDSDWSTSITNAWYEAVIWCDGMRFAHVATFGEALRLVDLLNHEEASE